MDHNQQQQNKYYRAKERVQRIKKFYNSLVGYVIFISFLAGLNYYVNELRYPWFLWAALGWGIGLIFMAANAYQWNPFMGKNWEERKLKEFMEEEEKKDRFN